MQLQQGELKPSESIRQERKDYYNDDDNSTVKTSEKLLNTIERLAVNLVKKRDIAVTARASSGIEQIWREDELAFEGLDDATLRTRMIDYATEAAPSRRNPKGPRRSRVYINIVRPKCETAEGRFSDIQLPTDDRNWGLKATPVPELSRRLDDKTPAKLKGDVKPLTDKEGIQTTMGDIAMSDIRVAKNKMSGMELEIDDQLTECDFNGECRKVIKNSVRLGTGILKGPLAVRDLKKTWRAVTQDGATVQLLDVKEGIRPSSRSCDPWDCFPDPDCKEDINKAAYMWEREAVLPRELRSLIGIEGYLTDQIEAVLLEEPTRVFVATPKDNQYLIRYNTVPIGNVYERWEYNGDLDKDDLESLGISTEGLGFASIGACVVMVNDRPIKIALNPLDTGELPYDFFVWTSRSGIPWGMGVAREMMWQQRIIVAAWRAMMDNAGDSSGANFVLGEGIEPMDGVWEIGGKKLWKAVGEQLDVQKAFAQFQIENNQDELQAIIELALRFIDMETNLPMIFGGEKGELPETLGATNILVDSNNVALRARVKLWDDAITRPHISRYYDWNMQYNPKNDIKGDYKVDPRGTSVLLERDLQSQSIEEVLPMRNDPELSDMVDWEKAIKQIFSAKHLDIILPEEKIKENRETRASQQQQIDPAIEAAQIRAQGDLKKAQMVQDANMKELQFKADQAKVNNQHMIEIKMIDRDIKAMELSVTSGIALDKIKAQLSETSAKLRTQVSLAKDKDVVPAEQIATPIAEPPGRAPEGQAFQK